MSEYTPEDLVRLISILGVTVEEIRLALNLPLEGFLGLVMAGPLQDGLGKGFKEAADNTKVCHGVMFCGKVECQLAALNKYELMRIVSEQGARDCVSKWREQVGDTAEEWYRRQTGQTEPE